MNIKDLIEAVKFQVSVKPQDEFMKEVAEGLEALYEENNRQKAEIKRLQNNQVVHMDISEQYKKECEYEIKTIKAKSVKEFAERLKDYDILPDLPWDVWKTFVDVIDKLVKERIGENNA